MDGEFDGIATGLSTCLTKDGQQLWAANQNTNGFKLTGLAAGSSANDSIRYGQFTNYQGDVSGGLTTGGTSTAYTVTTNEGSGITAIDGTRLVVTLHTTSGASPTLAADG